MITTRSIVTDYFNYRLRNQMITNNRLLSLIRRIADCETIYRSQNAIFRFNLSSSSALIHAKTIHREVGVELFNDGQITTARIMSFIVFSAILAETIIQQQPQNEDLIIESFIDWTTEFIDIDLHLWLENRHYWSICLNTCDQTTQRSNSVRRYATILSTVGILTFATWYFTKN